MYKTSHIVTPSSESHVMPDIIWLQRLLLCHMVEELRTNAIYSPPELHLIMLSFAAQAFYGNYNEKKYRPEQLHDLIGHTE